MELLKHWHPVIESNRLKKKPISVNLCGQEIVLFRTLGDEVGALYNRCCHRGMRLSCGWVEGEEIVCPYHGWKYTSCGNVFSPGTPKLDLSVSSFTAIERYGVIWIKSADSPATFPDFNVEDYLSAGVLTHEIQAPLEFVLDYFSEIEHTPTTHTYFGYSSEGISKVETNVKTKDNSVSVNNKGIQQYLPWIVQKLFFNVHSGDWFFDNWETFFSPVYSIYDQFWVDPVTDQPRKLRLKLVMFFIPITETQTRIMMFVCASPVVNKFIFQLLGKPVVRFFINYELIKDKRILENIADREISLSQMRLGRFDRVLAENRKRINRLYRGETHQSTV